MALKQLTAQIKAHICEFFQLAEEQVDGMLPVFLSTLQTHMETLESALEENNLKGIGKAGHTMKGALLNLGLNEQAAIALQIEEEGKAGNCDADFAKLLGELRENLKEIL